MNDSNIQSRSLGFFSFIRLQKQHIIALIASSSVLILLGYASLILRMHYSTDSYHLIDNQQAYWYLQNGRYTWWQLTMWLDQAGINLVLDQRPLLVLAVISFIFSLFSLTFIFAFKANLSTLPFRRRIHAIPRSCSFCSSWVFIYYLSGRIDNGIQSVAKRHRITGMFAHRDRVLPKFTWILSRFGSDWRVPAHDFVRIGASHSGRNG